MSMSCSTLFITSFARSFFDFWESSRRLSFHPLLLWTHLLLILPKASALKTNCQNRQPTQNAETEQRKFHAEWKNGLPVTSIKTTLKWYFFNIYNNEFAFMYIIFNKSAWIQPGPSHPYGTNHGRKPIKSKNFWKRPFKGRCLTHSPRGAGQPCDGPKYNTFKNSGATKLTILALKKFAV